MSDIRTNDKFNIGYQIGKCVQAIESEMLEAGRVGITKEAAQGRIDAVEYHYSKLGVWLQTLRDCHER